MYVSHVSGLRACLLITLHMKAVECFFFSFSSFFFSFFLCFFFSLVPRGTRSKKVSRHVPTCGLATRVCFLRSNARRRLFFANPFFFFFCFFILARTEWKTSQSTVLRCFLACLYVFVRGKRGGGGGEVFFIFFFFIRRKKKMDDV